MAFARPEPSKSIREKAEDNEILTYNAKELVKIALGEQALVLPDIFFVCSSWRNYRISDGYYNNGELHAVRK